MDIIKHFGLIVCLLMVLMAYLKQAIPRGKTTVLMKSIISIFILISIVDGVRTMDLNRLKDIFDQPYNIISDETFSEIGEGLKDEFNSFLENQGIDAEVMEIKMDRNVVVEKVILVGNEWRNAKELLSARYQIEKQNIEVKNE